MTKPIWTSILMVAALSFSASALRATNSDFDFHFTAKKMSEQEKKASGEARMGKDMFGQPMLQTGGGTNHGNEDWVYEVTIENKTFHDLAGLEIKYTIYYDQEKLGSKEAPVLAQRKGTFTLPALRAHDKGTFTTDSVSLKKSNLVGEYHYQSGGRIKAQDTLVGMVVRVYQGGQQLAEYANPSTLLREKQN